MKLVNILLEKKQEDPDPHTILKQDPDDPEWSIVEYNPLKAIEGDIDAVLKRLKVLRDMFPEDRRIREEAVGFATWRRGFIQYTKIKKKEIERERENRR